MPQDILTELLELRQQLDAIIAKVRTEHLPALETILHQAAATLPNPAPAAALIRTVATQLPHGSRRISRLLQAHGYRLQRRAAGNFYWRPSPPAPSAHELPDPEQQQDQ